DRMPQASGSGSVPSRGDQRDHVGPAFGQARHRVLVCRCIRENMKLIGAFVISAVFLVCGVSLHGASPEKGHLEGGIIKATIEADVCVYGASPSGVLAAVAAAREGCSVVI